MLVPGTMPRLLGWSGGVEVRRHRSLDYVMSCTKTGPTSQDPSRLDVPLLRTGVKSLERLSRCQSIALQEQS